MKSFFQLREELNYFAEASKITNQKKKSAIRDLSHGGSNDPHTGHAGMSRHHASMADEHKGTEAGKHHQRASDHHERALAALKKGNLKSGLAHAKNASDAASAAFNSNKHSSSHGGMKDSQALHKHHEREVGFNVGNKSRDAENLKRDKPKRSDKPIQRAIGKTKSTFKKLIGNKKQTSEGFVSEGAEPTAKQVRMAKGIARDKRYAKGNMTGAVKTMDKINPKLANHPKVKDELRKQNEDKASDRATLQKAMDAFKRKGGQIKKVAPGKAAGYHGKDDPGSDVHGMINKDDSKAIGTRKKVKSMGEAKQTHMFDNEKDARAKAKEIGGKYVKGIGKSAGKHAAIREKQVNEISKKTVGSYIKKASDDMSKQADKMARAQRTDGEMDKAVNKFVNRRRGIARAVNKMTTELTHDTMNKYYDKAKKSLHRAKNSHDANIMRKTDPSKDKATVDKRVKGIKLAKARSIKKIRGDK